MATNTAYYLSSLAQPCGYLARPEGGLHTTVAGALGELPRRILREAHPTVALESFIVGLEAEDATPITGEVGVMRAAAGWVVSCTALVDNLGRYAPALMRLREMQEMRWHARPLVGVGWLANLIGGGGNADYGAKYWQKHLTHLASALPTSALPPTYQPLVAEAYVKAVELAVTLMQRGMSEEERRGFEIMFDSACALLGRRFAALGHRYHECQGLLTILALATAVSASGVGETGQERSLAYDEITLLANEPAVAYASEASRIAYSFAPLFAMLRLGGVAAVYREVGSQVQRLAALPIKKTLVEQVKVAAYYA